jgi:hypothetical protein
MKPDLNKMTVFFSQVNLVRVPKGLGSGLRAVFQIAETVGGL